MTAAYDRPVTAFIVARLRREAPVLLASLVLMGVVSGALGAQLLLLKRVVDEVWAERAESSSISIPILLVVAYLLQAVAEVARGVLLRRTALRLVSELRLKLFDRAQRLTVSELEREGAGATVARVLQEPEVVQRIVTLLLTAIQKPLSLLVLAFTAYLQQPALLLSVLLLLPLIWIPLHWMSRTAKRAARALLEQSALLQARVQEAATAGRLIRTFQLQGFVLKRVEPLLEQWLESAVRSTLLQQSAGPLVQALVAIGMGVLIWAGGRHVAAGEGSAGAMISFLVSLGLMYDPLKGLAQLPILRAQVHVSLERMEEWWSRPIEPEGAPEPRMLAVAEADSCGPRPPALNLEGVEIGYGDHTVLQGVSLSVRRGELVAVVGPSGAGKSTLLSCIVRLLEHWNGTIQLDGMDIRQLSIQMVRKHVALVEQMPVLLDGTIEENVLLGRQLAAEWVRNALVRSGIEGEDPQLKGMEPTKRVGEGGARLSGGQRQRVALARALAGSPAVLLLDEATAALDGDSERRLLTGLRLGLSGMAVLFCTHRRSVAWAADRVLVLDQGKIVEEGRADVLFGRGGAFAKLVMSGMLEDVRAGAAAQWKDNEFDTE